MTTARARSRATETRLGLAVATVLSAQRTDVRVCVPAADWPSSGAGPTDPTLAAALVRGPETEHLLDLAGVLRP